MVCRQRTSRNRAAPLRDGKQGRGAQTGQGLDCPFVGCIVKPEKPMHSPLPSRPVDMRTATLET